MTTAPPRGGPLALIPDTFALWFRFLPQLLALALAGTMLNELLIFGAVWIGYHNRLAGLLSLTLVVLVKLVIIVVMLETLRPGLPAITQATLTAKKEAEAEAEQSKKSHDTGWKRLPTVVSITLVPFFAYYAAWGFLGDTIREYAREGLGQFNPFDKTYSGSLFDVSGGWWLVASIAMLWVIRWSAKRLKKRRDNPAWNVLIVLCEAGWTFVGLYVISQWQGGLFHWLAERRIGDMGRDLWQAINPVGIAKAELSGPIEATPPSTTGVLTTLFFTALLPIVWLALVALIYRYDVHDSGLGASGSWSGRVDGTVARWNKLPAWLRDFIGHFWAGTAKRYRAAANSVYLAGAAGLVPLVVLVVVYNALDWLSAWAWMGATRLIGPHTRVVWEGVSDQISIVLGTPSDPGGGIIPQTLSICLLAAALERSFKVGRVWHKLM
jgi:hypothetical protein